MTTVFEVAVKGSFLGEVHDNIFHVFDGDDNATPEAIAEAFDLQYLAAMEPLCSVAMVWSEIEVTSITAVNPGATVLPVVRSGENPDDPYAAGNHIWTKFVSDDLGFKAGGKMVGGFVETQYLAGVPIDALLDAMQGVFNLLITNLPLAASVFLAIYRPSLSVPGFPQISLVASALVRGHSTNNRRNSPFERG